MNEDHLKVGFGKISLSKMLKIFFIVYQTADRLHKCLTCSVCICGE